MRFSTFAFAELKLISVFDFVESVQEISDEFIFPKEGGMILLGHSKVGSEPIKYFYNIYDTELAFVTKVWVEIPAGFNYEGDYELSKDENSVLFIFKNKNKVNKKVMLRIDAEFKSSVHEFELGKYDYIEQTVFTGDSYFMYGATKKTSILWTFNFEKNVIEKHPEINLPYPAYGDIPLQVLEKSNEVVFAYSNALPLPDKFITFLFYSSTGELLKEKETTLSNSQDQYISSFYFNEYEKGKVVLSGFYSNNLNNKRVGWFFTELKNGRFQKLKTFDFDDFEKLSSCLPENLQNSFDADRKKALTDKRLWALPWIFHGSSAIYANGKFYFFLEFFNSEILSKKRVVYFSSSQIEMGYRFSHAFVFCINEQGEFEWELCLPMDLISDNTGIKTSVIETKKGTQISFLDRDEMKSTIFSNGDQREMSGSLHELLEENGYDASKGIAYVFHYLDEQYILFNYWSERYKYTPPNSTAVTWKTRDVYRAFRFKLR